MVDGPAPALRVRLHGALLAARRARDPVATAALRSTLGAIDNAEAVAIDDTSRGDGDYGGTGMGEAGVGAADVPRRDLLEDEVVELVRGEISERGAAALEYEQCGQPERAAQLRAEAAVLANLLDG